MAEKYVQNTKYKYELNASLVIQGNKSGAPRGENDPTGEGSTLAGTKLSGFGDRVQRTKPTELQEKALKKLEKQAKQSNKEVLNRKKGGSQAAGSAAMIDTTGGAFRNRQDVLNVEIQEELVYRPKTKETRAFYEQMIMVVQRHMGDHSLDVIKGALDEIIAILKAEGLKDTERKSEIEGIIDRLSEADFNNLTVLGQQLTDYLSDEQKAQGKAAGQGDEIDEMQVDPEMQFSGSESSDFEDVYQVKEDGEGQINRQAVVAGDEISQKDLASLTETQGTATVIQQATISSKQDAKNAKSVNQNKLTIPKIDAQWLNRTLTKFLAGKPAEEILRLESQVLSLLGNSGVSQRECEKKLIGLVSHKNIELVSRLLKNREVVFFGTCLQQAQNAAEKEAILEKIRQSKQSSILLAQLTGEAADSDQQTRSGERKNRLVADDVSLKLLYKPVTDDMLKKYTSGADQNLKVVDLDAAKFEEGARFMANKKCNLPRGSTKIEKKGYDEIHVPAVRNAEKGERLIPVSELPQWTHKAFPQDMKTLNVIQSRLFNSAFNSSENLLVCAPTGAGKTNIAMLAILQTLSQRRKPNGRIDTKSFKIIYIAPMKALVTEIVGNFQKRLIDYGIQVRELTGDVHLTRQQIDETQIIVTTPEKWDIVTRKAGERTYIDLVKLIIIDEIHLLHDSRGPVLEAIVSRTIRQIEQTSELVRIVALSATLPNYQDVAAFLRVNPETGLHYFDQSYRPVPLEQIYVGITEKKAIKRMMLLNEICYQKVIERAGKHQILIFSHSRKETARTAKIIRDMALAQDQLQLFLKEDSESKEILMSQVQKCDSQDLRDVLPYGLGIHHAGMSKRDRKMVEDLFAAGYLQVLCSTATLAWGVNLPAHTVILKGTQIYSPELGKWIELSPQDVLQMMGRAGRPQFDTEGEGIILTNHSELQYYLSMNNMQLPIESQMISALADQMCAEIVLGTISNTKEAVNWLSYTYLYVRMLRNPQLYGVEVSKADPTMIGRRHDLVYAAATLLSRSNMIKYDKVSGTLQSTALGKIASHYYIRHQSMQVYSENLKPHMSQIDIFRLFSLSKEFAFVPIRENEKLELQKFVERVPIPVKGTLDEPATKINILLQAYISRFQMEGYDLNADMVYVTQSASRIMRALFEICLKRGWAHLSQVMLSICKMVEKRLWGSMTPLRQFTQMMHLDDIARKIEKKAQFQWQHFYDMNAQQIGEIVNFPKMGKTILNQIHKFPRLELEAYVQPLTRTLVRIELDLKAHESFVWDQRYHGTAEPFWIYVEDCDSEQILHYEQFILHQKSVGEEHRISFTVPLFEPMPPQYFVKVISDRWLHAETSLPISFKHLLLPEKFTAPTQLQDLYPRLVKDLQFEEVEQLYGQIDQVSEFNPIQTQVFSKVYQSDESIFIGAPSGSGLLTCAELAIFRELQSEDGGKILYIAPNNLLCDSVFANWQRRLTKHLGLQIALIDPAESFAQQAAEMQQADIIIATPDTWDTISRRWRTRKALHQITVCIFDQLHLLSPTYEVVVSRCRLIQSELKDVTLPSKKAPRPIRMVGLACPIANGRDIAMWLGVSMEAGAYFNFSPSVRPTPIEKSVQCFDQFTRHARLLAMAKPAYNHIKKHFACEEESEDGIRKTRAVVFVSDRKQARITALDFVTFATCDENTNLFKNSSLFKDENAVLEKFSEVSTKRCLEHGVGIIHDGLSKGEMTLMKKLFNDSFIRILVVTQNFCWELSGMASNMVILMDVEKYDGSEGRMVEYPIADVLQMEGLASSSLQMADGQKLAPKCLLMCYTPRRDYFVKFLQEPLPVESDLAENLHDALNAEIVVGTITSKQDAVDWMTWTFLYRRLSPNPNYYNLSGRTAQHLNDFLSQLIEDTVEDLQTAKCVKVDEENEMDIEPVNFGKIAAFYGIRYQTIGLFALKLQDEQVLSKKMKALIAVLSEASEFAQIPIRDGEEPLLRQLAQFATYPIFEGGRNKDGDPIETHDYNETKAKTNLLLQCHFNRKPLNVDLRLDQRLILQKSVKLIHAMIDVISTYGNLNATLLAMELSQMVIQAMWPQQSPLLQLPGFDLDLVHALKTKAQVEEVSDFMNMDDDMRAKLVPVSEEQMTKLANVCNRYPLVEIKYQTEKGSENDPVGAYALDEPINITVTLQRDEDEDEKEALEVFNRPVYAQFYPEKKSEEWWVVVGHSQTGKLLAIKKVTNFKAQASTESKLGFQITESEIGAGKHEADLKIYLICDSYIGCDLQEDLKVKIATD